MPKLTARNALYAVVGVSDVAFEKAKTFTGGVRSYANKNRSPRTFVRSTSKDAQTLFGRTIRNTRSFITKRQRKAMRAYDGLAGRGQRLVTRIRRQSATQRVSTEAQKAQRQVRSAARSVRNAASAGLQATRGAADKVAG
jgi:hypothetical protein